MGELALVNKPNIYEYYDYRSFLKDQFNYLKSVDNEFSLRSLSVRIGVSPSYFTAVLKNRSPLPDNVIFSLDGKIGLNKNEHSFLFYLVRMIEAKNLKEQREVFKKISRVGLYKNYSKLNVAAHEYYSHWYYIAIRELSEVKDFKLDPKWIQKKLQKTVSLSEIRQAIRFLTENGFMAVNEKGETKYIQKNIFGKGPLFRLATAEFYHQLYTQAVESIYTVPSDERIIASHTVAVSEDEKIEVEKVLLEARNKIKEITKSKKTKNKDRVYHVSLMAIPLSKGVSK